MSYQRRYVLDDLSASATPDQMTASEKKTAADRDFSGEKEDPLSELPDDILVRILSLLPYWQAVQTASVSRRWERLVAQLPDLSFHLSFVDFTTSSRATPSEQEQRRVQSMARTEQRVQSMARTLHRRCRDRGSHPIKTLHLFYKKEVAMECRYADEFIALANATKLVLSLQRDWGSLPNEDAGGCWSIQLPPATTELQVRPCRYTVGLPAHIHGSAVHTLRSLTLVGQMVMLRQEASALVATVLPSLEDLHIGECTLAGSLAITSHAMPRLKHLRITDVSLLMAAVVVLVDELRTLHMSCHLCSWSKPAPSSEREMLRRPLSRYQKSFTKYSSFRLRAPRLRVFEWGCCYADEVCIESVGRLSDVAVEVAAVRMPTPFGGGEEKYVTVEQRDQLMTSILQGLMPGLQPLGWENVKRKCKQRDDRWLSFEITNAYPLAE